MTAAYKHTLKPQRPTLRLGSVPTKPARTFFVETDGLRWYFRIEFEERKMFVGCVPPESLSRDVVKDFIVTHEPMLSRITNSMLNYMLIKACDIGYVIKY